jgi:hypothetical protein
MGWWIGGGIAMGVSSAIGAAEKWYGLISKGVGIIEEWTHGKPKISRPQHKDVVVEQTVEFVGTYQPRLLDRQEQPQLFWLITRIGGKIWPQHCLEFLSDGAWNSPVLIWHGTRPRFCTVILVRVTPFVDQIFRDFKQRGTTTGFWDGMEIRPPRREMRTIEAMELQTTGPTTNANIQS